MPNHGGMCPNTLQILRQDVPTTLKDGFRCCRTFSYFHFGDDRRISTRATGDDGYFFRTWKPNKSFVSMAVRGDVAFREILHLPTFIFFVFYNFANFVSQLTFCTGAKLKLRCFFQGFSASQLLWETLTI